MNDSKAQSVPPLLWIVLAAVVLISMGCALRFAPRSPDVLISDSSEYSSLAVSMVEGHSYQNCLFRAPGYPAFLAAIYLLAGHDRLWPVYLAQSLLLALTLFLLYRIAFYVTNDRRASIVAVCLCAVWPPLYLAAGAVLTEILSGALIAASLWLLIGIMSRPSLGRCIGLGLVMGAAALVKGPFLLFVPAAAAFIVFSGSDRLRRLKLALAAIAAMALVVGPWTVRNYRVSGAFVPVQTGAGMTFWMGNWPKYWHIARGFGELPYPPELAKALEGKAEIERERVFTRFGWGYIKEDPVRAAGIFVTKFSFLWLGALGADPGASLNPIPHIGGFGITKRSIAYAPLFVVAVLGWFLLACDARKRSYPVLALLALWTLSYVITVAAARYMVPVVCYEMLFASVALARIGVRKT